MRDLSSEESKESLRAVWISSGCADASQRALKKLIRNWGLLSDKGNS